MRSVMPNGYCTVRGIDCKVLIIGMGFGTFNKKAAKYIMCNDVVYKRGGLIPLEEPYMNTFCSMREYHRTKLKDLPRKTVDYEELSHFNHVVVIHGDKYIMARVDIINNEIEYTVHSDLIPGGRSRPYRDLEDAVNLYNQS